MKIRAFFSLSLSQSVVRALADHADKLAEFDRKAEVNWVDSEQYHLTLCFLGDITLQQVDQLEALCRERLAEIDSLMVHVNSACDYRVSKKYSLLAALTDQSEQLMALHDLVAEVAVEAGIDYLETDFKPHITLGRMSTKNHFKRPEKWPEVELYSLADSVMLLQSRPGERGSIYTPLFEIALQDLA